MGWLRELSEYWRNDYDWRAAERELNQFPQYTTTIDGQRIYFIHVRSAEPDALPLILTHGWPGSVVEFLGLIGPLTNPVAHGGDGGDAFDVVIPALPGFGFSGPVSESGWTTTRIATAWDELMTRLGYDRYGTQGGDIGAVVAPEVGRIAPDRVVGVHTNGGPGGFPTVPVPEHVMATLSPIERDRIARIEAFMREESGYLAIQSTRPQSLGYGLTDSAVGQLAWIMDKFREWTHPRKELPDRILSRDRLLTNVMTYWLTGTAASSAYVGYAQSSGWGAPKVNSGVPTTSESASSPRSTTPSLAGPRWIGAATSPPWRNQRPWWRTSANSSGPYDDSTSASLRRACRQMYACSACRQPHRGGTAQEPTRFARSMLPQRS